MFSNLLFFSQRFLTTAPVVDVIAINIAKHRNRPMLL